MTTNKLTSEFEATYTESLWGGNKSGYVLKENGEPQGRIEMPTSTGDKKQDDALLQGVMNAVDAWENNGTVLEL